jgi:hypothetical protein
MSKTQSANEAPGLLLQEFIVALLIPLFLSTVGGDLGLARAAAHHVLTSHGARSPLELLFIAQAFAFGAAALVAIGEVPPDDTPASLKLHLRANANALSRSAERCCTLVERSLQRPLPSPLDPHEHAALMEAAARAKRITAAPIVPAPITAGSAEPATATQPAPVRAVWAAAMADVAEEVAASYSNLSPQQRHAASIHIRALTSAAQTLQHETDPAPGAAPGPEDAPQPLPDGCR